MIQKVFVSIGMRIFGALAPVALSYLIINFYETDESSKALNFIVLVAFIKIFLSRGLPSASLRFFASEPTHVSRYFWQTFIKLNVNSLQLVLLALILVLLVSSGSVLDALIVVLSAHIGANLLFGRFVAVAQKRVALSILSEPLGVSLIAAALLVLVAQFRVAISFEYLYLLASVLVAIPAFFILKPRKMSIDRGSVNDDLNQSAWKFYQINLLSYLVNWGPVVAAAYFLSAQYSQDLNISVRLASSVTLVLVSLNAVFAPDLARSFKAGDRSRVVLLSGTFLLWSQLSTFIFCSVLFILSDRLLQFADGGDYSDYLLNPMQVVIIGQMISGISGPCFGILNMSGNEKYQLQSIAVGFLMSTLSLLVLGLHSIFAFAFAYAIGLVSQNLFGVYKVHKVLGINLLFIVFSREYINLRGKP